MMHEIGTIGIRMRPSLYKLVKIRAKEEGISVSKMMGKAIVQRNAKFPSSIDYEKKSKAFGISIDPNIIDEARAKASANDQTLSTYAVEAVKAYLKEAHSED